MNTDKLAKMKANVRTGGKHSVRRKKKVVKRRAAAGDQKLNSLIKRLNVNTIPGIDEVNMFKNDGTVIHFQQPKVQASLPSNTYVVSGTAEVKPLQELFPGILSQLGPELMNNLKQMAEASGMGAAAGGDDDVPALDDEIPTLEE